MTEKISRALVRRWLPRRRRGAHKGDFGHVLVAAGSRGMAGAARLCALGALRGGAGRVTLAVPGTLKAFTAAGPWEAMSLSLPVSAGAFSLQAVGPFLEYAEGRRVSSVVMGPGLSDVKSVSRFLSGAVPRLRVPLVLDADGLNVLAAASRIFRPQGSWILTPHPGEAARLSGIPTARVQSDRVAAARRLAERYGAVVALKGAGTLVTDGRAVYLNDTGNPGMASGGMGDVLAGLAGALVPQVSASSPGEACLRAAVAAVWMHGRAGDLVARDVGPAGITASDVAARLPAVFQELW